jgi:hypothetical protein
VKPPHIGWIKKMRIFPNVCLGFLVCAAQYKDRIASRGSIRPNDFKSLGFRFRNTLGFVSREGSLVFYECPTHQPSLQSHITNTQGIMVRYNGNLLIAFSALSSPTAAINTIVKFAIKPTKVNNTKLNKKTSLIVFTACKPF